MVDPQIEDLVEKTGSKFVLALLAAKRARQLNNYYNQLGEGLGAIVPPQVTTVSSKPVSIAFEEIAAGKIVPAWPEEAEPEAQSSQTDAPDSEQ